MYDTPRHVADQLALHFPKRPRRLLDPAVGNGALLAPLWNRLAAARPEIVCLDSDSEVLQAFTSSTQDRAQNFCCLHADFLEWGPAVEPNYFDCIVMNPPFAAGARHCTVLPSEVVDELGGDTPSGPIPLEAAFVCLAHRVLAPNGRLLAILPCSVIMAESLRWLRSLLFASGRLDFLYEFPARTFPKLDSPIYLMVFSKGARRTRLRLRKYLPNSPKEMVLRYSNGNFPSRLDFGFHHSSEQMQFLHCKPEFQWTRLAQVARIFRGTVPSPARNSDIVHSTNYRTGYWRSSALLPFPSDADARRIHLGDLLVRRVGRNCHLSFGSAYQVHDHWASDCVFVIRPKEGACPLRLLFSVKVITSFRWSAALMERGTGARYLSKSSLEELSIPLAAPNIFSDEFRAFSQAYMNGCCEKAEEAVSRISHVLSTSIPA